MEIGKAIEQFCCAAIEKANFSSPASKDRVLFRKMAKAWLALEEHGAAGRQAFKDLLSHESRYVRCWVASQLLALGDESGIPFLKADVAHGDLQSTSSEMVLTEWMKGKLKPPFDGP
jgi:hypothetical protein